MTEDNIFLCTFLSFVPKIVYFFQALSLRGNSLSYDIIIFQAMWLHVQSGAYINLLFGNPMSFVSA